MADRERQEGSVYQSRAVQGVLASTVKCNWLLWLIIPPYRAIDKAQEEVLTAQGHWLTWALPVCRIQAESSPWLQERASNTVDCMSID